MTCNCWECQVSRDDYSYDAYLEDEDQRITAFIVLGFTEDYALDMVWGATS